MVAVQSRQFGNVSYRDLSTLANRNYLELSRNIASSLNKDYADASNIRSCPVGAAPFKVAKSTNPKPKTLILFLVAVFTVSNKYNDPKYDSG